jgi:hypothetical protein
MKRITASLGACALLFTFSAPAAVHATTTSASAKSMNIVWGEAARNVVWGDSYLPVGTTVGAEPVSGGVSVVALTPQGELITGTMTNAEFASLAPNVVWGN